MWTHGKHCSDDTPLYLHAPDRMAERGEWPSHTLGDRAILDQGIRTLVEINQ